MSSFLVYFSLFVSVPLSLPVVPCQLVTYLCEDTLEVWGSDDAILVLVNDTECLLELLKYGHGWLERLWVRSVTPKRGKI